MDPRVCATAFGLLRRGWRCRGTRHGNGAPWLPRPSSFRNRMPPQCSTPRSGMTRIVRSRRSSSLVAFQPIVCSHIVCRGGAGEGETW